MKILPRAQMGATALPCSWLVPRQPLVHPGQSGRNWWGRPHRAIGSPPWGQTAMVLLKLFCQSFCAKTKRQQACPAFLTAAFPVLLTP